jgi:hypothetical protein
MTVMTKTPKPAKPTSWDVGGGFWPQVDLLPPEVRQARKLKSLRRSLLIGVVGVAVVVALGGVAAFVSAAAASNELAGVQKDTATLLAEQTKYAEVPRVLARISTAEADRQVGMSTEILWKPYLQALQAVTPAGVSYDDITVAASTPLAPGPASTNTLAAPSMGQIAFTTRSLTLPDMSGWTDAISQVPGLGDPWFTTATLTDQNGAVYYKVTATVDINDTALAHRFVPAKGK